MDGMIAAPALSPSGRERVGREAVRGWSGRRAAPGAAHTDVPPPCPLHQRNGGAF